ncbi:MAG: hypothetical protein ACM3X1_04575 [Ignavibacteriales bacterium]
MGRQQLLLKQELTISEILRTYGKQFKQIAERYSDGHNGRCALGVIMSYYGWNGKDDSQAASQLLGTLIALRCAGVDKNLLIEMNDSGLSFDEIADYLDKIGGSKYW